MTSLKTYLHEETTEEALPTILVFEIVVLETGFLFTVLDTLVEVGFFIVFTTIFSGCGFGSGFTKRDKVYASCNERPGTKIACHLS